jgi:hypothetical protein
MLFLKRLVFTEVLKMMRETVISSTEKNTEFTIHRTNMGEIKTVSHNETVYQVTLKLFTTLIDEQESFLQNSLWVVHRQVYPLPVLL